VKVADDKNNASDVNVT